MSMADDPANLSAAGKWVTEDGRIRQELLLNGRYDETRDGGRSA